MNKDFYKTHKCDESFVCIKCKHLCEPKNAATGHRNHCPDCLSSLHLDNEPGDRAALCGGEMEAIGVWVRRDGEWAIIHRCRKCGTLKSNRIAADDNVLKLLSIALKPLCEPPFPTEYLKRIAKKLENGNAITY